MLLHVPIIYLIDSFIGPNAIQKVGKATGEMDLFRIFEKVKPVEGLTFGLVGCYREIKV